MCALFIVFQNFTPFSNSNDGPQERLILPLKPAMIETSGYQDELQSNLQANVQPNLQANIQPNPQANVAPPVECLESDKRVVYLSLVGVQDGEHLTGTVADPEHQQEISVNIVVGRDFEIGNCDNRNFSVQGRLKICFPEAAGVYLDFKVEDDSNQVVISEHFPSHSYCENQSNWFSAQLSDRRTN
jgi:hypothetical protein